MKKFGIILIMLVLSLSFVFSQTVKNEEPKPGERSLLAIRNNSRDNAIMYKNNVRNTITLQPKMSVMNQSQMKTQMQRRIILQRRRQMINQQQLKQRYIRQRMIQQQQQQQQQQHHRQGR